VGKKLGVMEELVYIDVPGAVDSVESVHVLSILGQIQPALVR